MNTTNQVNKYKNERPSFSKRLKSRCIEMGLLIVFKVLLDLSYIYFVNPTYKYMGFSLDINSIKLLESYLFCILIFFFLPIGEKTPSRLGIKLLFLLIIVPTSTIYALKNESRAFFYFLLGGFFITLLIIKILPTFNIRKIKTKYTLFFIVGVASILVYIILIILNGIPSFQAFHFSEVYEIRKNYKLGPFFMSYLFIWQAKILNCFLIAFAWYYKRYFLLLIFISMQVLIFLISGHKFFLIFPLFAIWIIFTAQRKNFFRLTTISLIVLICLSYGLYLGGHGIRMGSMIIRRSLLLPSLVSFFYYDFFSKNKLVYLSNSLLGSLFSNYQYEMPIPNMLANAYLNNPDINMNAGYLADAYMHFGFPGILILSVILGIIMRAIDSIVKRNSTPLTLSIGVTPLLSLINSGLLTSLFTHGILLSMIILWLFNKRFNSRWNIPHIFRAPWRTIFR